MIASIWLRYFSSARRPAAVSRYSVRGTRPSNDLSQATYSASSSFRACTLRLPSVVCSSRLRSVNDSRSLAASALTMPRRSRSWMTRSRSSAVRFCTRSAPVFRLSSFDSRLSTANFLLTAIAPRNHVSEPEMKRAESGGHESVAPLDRRDEGRDAEKHETQTEQRHDAHRERAAGRHGGAVQEEPAAGQPRDEAV